MALTSSSHPSGSAPFTTLRRVPLAELPLRNYIERPPSPLKSYSSPGKIQPAILGVSPKPKSHSPSPSRPSSGVHVDLSSRHQLFRDALRKGDSSNPSSKSTGTENSRKSSPIEGGQGSQTPPITSPKPVKATTFATPVLSPSSSSRSLLQRSPLQAWPTKKLVTSAPQSLGKKKERIRRQLLDEDEEGGADIRAGSPSPSKMKAEREGALRGSSSSSSQLKEQKQKEVMWTVWQDDDEATDSITEPASLAVEGGPVEEEDKENAKPSRKKGTGGRLSLLATGDDTEADTTVDVHEKRRRVTPPGPVI